MIRFALTLVFAVLVAAQPSVAETVQPRYPVPTHVSPEAQAILAAPIQIRESAPPTTKAEWHARTAATEAELRAMFAPALAQAPVTITKRKIAGVTVRELVPAQGEPVAGKVLMNLHGGGYTLLGGDLSVIEGLQFAAVGGYRVISVDYRMPPEHPFPAAVDDGIAVYRELVKTYGAENIAIFGASAGGGLTASVTVAARDAGLPLPAAVVLNTPWADLSKTGDSYFSNDRVDPVLPTFDGPLAQGAALYAGDAGLKHPLVSPVYADYSKGFPPTLLSTGTRDLLLSCTVRLHRALRKAGVEAELHVWDAMWHGLSMVPEGKELRDETLLFFAKHLGKPAP